MCGICGFNFEDENLINQGSLSLSSRVGNTSISYISRNLSLYHAALRLTDMEYEIVQPYKNNNIIVSFVGEIYNREYLISHFLETEKPTLGELELIEKLYVRLGKEFINYINGEFFIFIFDEVKNTYYFFRDRYGTKALYYKIDKEKIYFASEIKCLLALLRNKIIKIDHESIFQYITFGFTISPNTIFKNISIIPPGNILEFKGGDVVLTPFSEYIPQSPSKNFIETFEAAIVRRIPVGHDSMFVPLSGGKDSNLTLFFLKKHFKGTIISYSFLSENNARDVEVASQNAKYQKIKHEIIDLRTSKRSSAYNLHEGLVDLIDFSSVVRESLSVYKNTYIEFSGDGREEGLFTNTHFDYNKILTYYKSLVSASKIKKYEINTSFLNYSMFDFNLQLMEKITLNSLIERRLPFTDYELLQYSGYDKYDMEAEEFLLSHGWEIVDSVYGHNDSVDFLYPSTQQEVIQKLKFYLDTIRT